MYARMHIHERKGEGERAREGKRESVEVIKN